LDIVFVLLPPEPVTVNATVYVPAAEYTWLGFCALLVVPSPNVHPYVVMVPVDVLVKFIASGATPDVVLAVKLATGAAEGTVAATSLEKADSLCDASYDVTAKWYVVPAVRLLTVCVVTLPTSICDV
jgi:hypothetical protein